MATARGIQASGQMRISQQSYQEIKEHFMQRFQQIDREFIQLNAMPPAQAQLMTEQKIQTFV